MVSGCGIFRIFSDASLKKITDGKMLLFTDEHYKFSSPLYCLELLLIDFNSFITESPIFLNLMSLLIAEPYLWINLDPGTRTSHSLSHTWRWHDDMSMVDAKVSSVYLMPTNFSTTTQPSKIRISE